MDYTPHLFAALASPFGVIIETDDPKALKARLYACRRAAQNPELETLSFCTSPENPQSEVWIVRRAKEIGNTTGEEGS